MTQTWAVEAWGGGVQWGWQAEAGSPRNALLGRAKEHRGRVPGPCDHKAARGSHRGQGSGCTTVQLCGHLVRRSRAEQTLNITSTPPATGQHEGQRALGEVDALWEQMELGALTSAAVRMATFTGNLERKEGLLWGVLGPQCWEGWQGWGGGQDRV